MTFDFRRQHVTSMFSEGIEAQAPSSLADRRRRRAALFEESFTHAAARTIFEVGRALHPRHIAELAPALDALLRAGEASPAGLPAAQARRDGFCGLARDLSVPTLIEAYTQGLYPQAYAGTLKWWAPALRMVVDPASVGTPEAVRDLLSRRTPDVSFDQDFETVLAACAKAEESLWRPCWMSPKVKHAYAALHDAGFAHCFAVRDSDGALVAGGFGVAVGRVFVCESTFGTVGHWRDLGLTVLNRHLAQWGFAMHDAKTQVSDGFGFAPMARETYQERLATLLSGGRLGRWRVEAALCGPRAEVCPELSQAA